MRKDRFGGGGKLLPKAYTVPTNFFLRKTFSTNNSHKTLFLKDLIGGPYRDRTCGPLIKSQLLSLAYGKYLLAPKPYSKFWSQILNLQ